MCARQAHKISVSGHVPNPDITQTQTTPTHQHHHKDQTKQTKAYTYHKSIPLTKDLPSYTGHNITFTNLNMFNNITRTTHSYRWSESTPTSTSQF